MDSIWSKQKVNGVLQMLCASTIRNESTYALFTSTLAKHSFTFKSVYKERSGATASNYNNATPDCFIEILKIFK
jgi:hypothetical protein